MKNQTLSQIEEQLIKEAHGKNARPILFEKKDVQSLIEQNCGKKQKLNAFNIFKVITSKLIV